MYLLNATSIGIEMKGDADFTPLHNAVHEGHSDVAQVLVCFTEPLYSKNF